MSDPGVEIVLIVALIVVNGVFALAEFAMASSRKARLQQRVDEGDQRAKTALALFEHPLDFLSTVQIGITLIGVLAGLLYAPQWHAAPRGGGGCSAPWRAARCRGWRSPAISPGRATR